MNNAQIHNMLTELRNKHLHKIVFFLPTKDTSSLVSGLLQDINARVNAISALPLDEMPLHINDENFEVCECAKWRLKNNI